MTPAIAIIEPIICINEGRSKRNIALRNVDTIEFVFNIVVVGPARPFTDALRPSVLANIKQKLERKLIAKLYHVYDSFPDM